MRFSILVAAAILMVVAGCSAEQQPAHYFGRGGKSGSAKVSKGSSAIAGVWRAEQPGEAKPLAYITAIVQGDAIAITGVFTPENSAITGTGWYVSPARSSYSKADPYPTYKIYFGATAWAGWWTLVAIDGDTILPYAGEAPEIPSPPVQAPGQPVFKRVKY